jgi:hypothetical protein
LIDTQRESAQAQERAARAESHLAEANARADTARKEAEGFKLDIAKANEGAARAEREAAKFNEIAQREMLARLQLEAKLAPRSLTPEQQNNISRKLKQFVPMDLDVLIYGENFEIDSIRNSIASAVRGAGWNVRSWAVMSGGSAQGILVLTRSGSDSTTLQAAQSLILALTLEGLPPSSWTPFTDTSVPGVVFGPDWDPKKVAAIRMLIGSKP